MRPEPCAVCGVYRRDEMSNVIIGLCGWCARDRLHTAREDPNPFPKSELTFSEVAGMAMMGIKELPKIKKRWGMWEW